MAIARAMARGFMDRSLDSFALMEHRLGFHPGRHKWMRAKAHLSNCNESDWKEV